MKIVLVIPTLRQGGAERVLSELANNFSHVGHEVHLCLLAKSEDFYAVEPSVFIHRLGFENRGPVFKIISEATTFFRFRRLLIKEKPEVVLSFMAKFNIFTIIATRFLKLKVFISDRDNPRNKRTFKRNMLCKLTYKHATGIIAQTNLAKEILDAFTKNKNVKVIPNPVKKIDNTFGIPKEKIILNVGRMVTEKGQKYLIEAFDKMEDKNWKLVILGDGELRLALEKQIDNLNINDRVLMPGATKNIDEWLAKAAVFGFSSVSEGFPNALVEALATGLPCISFDCDAGPSDLIVDGVNGRLIKCRDTLALTKALNEICENSAMREKLGNKAKEINEKLDPNKIANEFLDFFNVKEKESYDRRY